MPPYLVPRLQVPRSYLLLPPLFYLPLPSPVASSPILPRSDYLRKSLALTLKQTVFVGCSEDARCSNVIATMDEASVSSARCLLQVCLLIEPQTHSSNPQPLLPDPKPSTVGRKLKPLNPEPPAEMNPEPQRLFVFLSRHARTDLGVGCDRARDTLPSNALAVRSSLRG